MDELFKNPITYLVILGVVSAIVTASIWVGKINERTGKTSELLKEIRDDIKRIFERLPPVTATSKSPAQLTDLGKKISKDLEVAGWVREAAETLREKTSGKPPYEVEELANTYVFSLVNFSPEEKEKVKECAYSNGLDKSKVYRVYVIELRDLLLEIHGIKNQND